MKKNRYFKVVIPLVVVLLLLQFLFFVMNSLEVVSETNKNNLAYTIKIRETIKEIDKIVDRAELNINVMAYSVIESYNLDKLHNEEYNLAYLETFDTLVKSILVNSPGVDGAWFQINADVPFSSKLYSWYVIDNGKIVNLKSKKLYDHRKITPKEDPYYFEALKNKKITWSDVYVDEDTKISMISISKPIYKKGKLIGVAGIDVSVNSLQNALANMQFAFEGSEIFLLDENGNTILCQLQNMQEKKHNHDFSILLKKKSENQDVLYEYYDRKINKTAILLSLANKYNLIITFPNTLVFKGIDKLYQSIYIIFSLLMILIGLIIRNKDKIIKINRQLQNEILTQKVIIKSAPTLILIKSVKGVYLDCNDKFLDLIGKSKNEVIGKTDYDIFPKDFADEIVESDEIVKSSKKTLIEEKWCPDQNGNKVLLRKYRVPLLNNNNELVGLLMNAIDITKVKQEQEMLQKAKDAAEKATAMKSNFLANMSHEIRTPLNGILGFMQLLKDTNLTDEQEEFINDAQKSSEILMNIINNILDFSKIEADKVQIDNISFDVRSLVEDITLMMTVNAEKKGLEVNSLICSDVPQNLFGDPGRIKQILSNLVNNSIKFTPKGEIIIYVKRLYEDSDNAVLSFEVKDTGIGIPEDKLDLIFEEFAQADTSMTRKFGGTGLGLAICKKLINLMDGSIYVKSKINEGSVFTFTLPFKKDNVLNQISNNYLKVFDGKKILVISDSTTDLKIIRYYLSDANCVIYQAYSSEDAFNILNNTYSQISVIIIDHKMHKIVNNEFSYLIKKNSPDKDIPLILYTSLTGIADFNSFKDKGFVGYITKPIKKNELIETIAMVLEGKEEKKFIEKNSEQSVKFNPNAKVLVVEDSELNSKLIVKILKNNGLTPDSVLNGMEAIEAVKSKDYDLILMDCQMPILDGYAATEEIRKWEGDTKHTPIIAMTANALSKDESKCYEFGMDDYISKPINIEDLLNIINKYIKRDYDQREPVNSELFDKHNFEEINDINIIINDMSSDLGFKKFEAIQFFMEYLESLPTFIYELKKMLKEKNFDELKMIAHKFKGSSSSLRIKKMAKLCIDLEEQISNKDENACEQLIFTMKQYTEYLNTLFLKFFNDCNDANVVL